MHTLLPFQPDLPYRLQHGIELNEPEQQTFYLPMSEKGYTTYPFSKEFLAAECAQQ